jgi:hypothetical protein
MATKEPTKKPETTPTPKAAPPPPAVPKQEAAPAATPTVEPAPAPSGVASLEGRTVKLPPKYWQGLEIRAKRSGVSLDQYIAQRLRFAGRG